MFNHELYASAFARAVDVMAPGNTNRDQQKAALRALVALAELSAASLRLYEGILSVDDIPIPDSVPHVTTLVKRLEAHRLAELMIGRQSEPAELLALLRGLAEEPGKGPSIKERLRDVQSKRIMVILERTEIATPRQRSVTQAFDVADIESAAGAVLGPVNGAPPETDALLSAWNAMHDGDVMDPGVKVEMPEAEGTEGTKGTDATDVSSVRGTGQDITSVPSVSSVPSVPSDPLEAALSRVVLDPYGNHLLDRLTLLSEQITRAMREDKPDEALRALAIVIDLEPGAPEGTPRNSYGIVLKRTLTRDVLAQVAQCLLTPALIEAGGKAMRRAKGEGAEVLLGLLATAEGLRERKAYMTVLRSIPDASDKVIGMLNHHQWFVVRNVAELLGELCIEEAVSDLGRTLTHSDQRVRRAAAISLAKIGSVGTVEPLRKALKDGTPEVRSAIAASISGSRARALAMPLVALAEAESNPDVQREYFRALGRIGTSEAIQALSNAAAPGGKVLNRKPTAVRLAAVDGLRIAKATAALGSLSEDGDKQVREAVAAALRESNR